MTLKAISVSGGTTKSGPETSTGVTSAPNERIASTTPSPDLSETSRSDPGPPMSTAIFLLARLRFIRARLECILSGYARMRGDLAARYLGRVGPKSNSPTHYDNLTHLIEARL